MVMVIFLFSNKYNPSIRSKINENSIENFINKSIRESDNEEKSKLLTKIIEKSESIIVDKVIKSGEEDETSKKKVIKIIGNLIDKNPEKAIEILEKNEKTKKLSKTIKTKIENGDAINVEDYDKVFDENISPN